MCSWEALSCEYFDENERHLQRGIAGNHSWPSDQSLFAFPLRIHFDSCMSPLFKLTILHRNMRERLF